MDNTVQVKVVLFYDKNGNVEATETVSITAEGKKVLSASAGYRLYPMNAEDINVKERGWDSDLIRHPLIGDTRYRCYMIPVPEDMYQPLMAMEWAKAQRNTLKRRCRIPAAGGTTKVCRNRSCYGCPMASEDRITSETVSLMRSWRTRIKYSHGPGLIQYEERTRTVPFFLREAADQSPL